MYVNFKHLYYFWVTARAGGVMRAGEQLHTTPQTLSGQIKLFEGWLGRKLFQKSGRHLDLTEHGRIALGYADQIFSLGSALEASLRQKELSQPRLVFRVGIADSVSKSLAYKLIEPAFGIAEPIRLVASEGKYADLLAQLALHRLDLVIADEPMPRRVSVKAYNHLLGRSGVSFFATPALRAGMQAPFPACLADQPLLLPSSSTAVRLQLDDWFVRAQITPQVLGEFDDAALMKAFGREGKGVFVSPSLLEDEICTQYGVEVVGRSPELVEEFYAVSVERLNKHPCLSAISKAAHGQLFGG